MTDVQPPEVPVEAVEVVEESTQKSNQQIAAEVIAGHWSRGQVRNRRLRDAGYDPAVVQQEVDKVFNR